MDLENFKNKVQGELQVFEKKIKTIQKPHSYEKELKAIENRMSLKLTNAIEKLGDVFT